MKKKICILSNCAVKNDGRIKKMIAFYETIGQVDFFYVDGEDNDANFFNNKTKLFSYQREKNLSITRKLFKSLFFWDEFNFYVKEVKSKGFIYDIVVANDLPTLKPASIISSSNPNCVLVYDSHEIYNETLNQFYPKDRSGIKKVIFNSIIFSSKFFGEIVESHYVKKATIFITVNESIARYFEKKYNVKKVHSIKNCPVTKKLDKTKIFNVRDEFNINEDDILFLYQGVINQGRALELFLRALKDTPDNIHFFLIGYGSFVDYLVKMVKELNLTDRVHFLGLIPNDNLHLYTPAFDFGVNMGNGNLSKNLGLSNKLFEYMHAGIPVLCSDNPENREIFDKYPFGYLTNNSHDDILRGIKYLTDKTKDTMFRKASLEAAKEYCWENEIKTLENLLINTSSIFDKKAK